MHTHTHRADSVSVNHVLHKLALARIIRNFIPDQMCYSRKPRCVFFELTSVLDLNILVRRTN